MKIFLKIAEVQNGTVFSSYLFDNIILFNRLKKKKEKAQVPGSK